MDISGAVYLAAKKLYRSLPLSVRTLLSPAASWYDRFWRLRPEVWLITGRERSSNLPFNSVIYVLTRQYRRYLTELIYGDCFRERYLGRAWIWNAFRKEPEKSHGAEAIFAEVHQSQLRYLGSKQRVVIPAWITGEADLQADERSLRHKSLRSDIRKMEVNQLEYHFANDKKSFEAFYHHMYVPYLKKRFGDAAFVLSFDRIHARFEAGRLLFITKQAEPIAGLLLTFENGQPYLRHVGVRDGKRDHVNDGAIAAAYEYAFRYLKKEGFSRVRLGRSRPFLSDGVLQFKKKRGQRIVSLSTHKFVFQALAETEPTRAFLCNNPFIFEERNNTTTGIVFVVTGTPLTAKLLLTTYGKYFQSGLSRLIVFFLSADGKSGFADSDLKCLNTEFRKSPRAQLYCERLSWFDSVELTRQIGCSGIPIAIYPTGKHE